MRISRIAVVLMTVLLVVSCEQPLDDVIKSVNSTKNILQNKTWHLTDFNIEVKNSDLPPPLLLSSSDSLIRQGKYSIDDMALDLPEMQTYQVKFTSDRDIITGGGEIDLLLDNNVGTYFVINDQLMRISSAEAINWKYFYDAKSRKLSITADEERASRLVRKTNDKLIKKIASKSPNKIGDLVAGLLFNNAAVQKLINDALVSAISGKLSFLNEINPEESSRVIAAQISEAIRAIDWEGKLKALLLVELEKINNIDAEAVAEAIAGEIVAIIDAKISTDGIYELLLPYIEQIPVNSEAISRTVSTLIVNVFLEVFDEDFLKTPISNAWQKFTELDSVKVKVIADTLTSIVEENFINQENLKVLILPITEKIASTSIFQMGNLAQEATDSIKVIVDGINGLFPDLNLSPDYVSMQSTLKAAFIAAKPTIGLVGGPENAANSAAGLIISQFLNTEAISGAFAAGINFLQAIDPETAGSTIAGWLVSLEGIVAPIAIDYLSNLLSPILENINPEFTAFKIAKALNDFIKTNITKETLSNLIFPIFEAITNINAEAVAEYIAQRVLELDVLKDNITQENIEQVLLTVLTKVQQVNVDQLAQDLIDAVVNSGIFEDTITESRVSAIIALLIYNSAWEDVKIVNNFKEATIILQHD